MGKRKWKRVKLQDLAGKETQERLLGIINQVNWELAPDIQEEIDRLKDIGLGYALAIASGAPEEPGHIIVQPLRDPAPDSPEKQASETATTGR